MLLFTYQILFAADFLLLPFFLLFWIGLFTMIRNRRYKVGSPIRKYFLPALIARLVGAILTALMYQYYYGGGDTFLYFIGAKDVFNAFIGDPYAAYEMLFYDLNDWRVETRDYLTLYNFFYKPNEAIVIRLSSWFTLPGLGTYLGTSLGVTSFSFVGCWCLYLVFYDLYPRLYRQTAYAILFLPSMCFWSTGVMKDPFTMAGLGYFVYGVYFLILKNNGKNIQNFLLILIGGFLMAKIKLYIIASIAPATILWVFLLLKDKIKDPTIRKIATPIFLSLGGAIGLVGIRVLGTYSTAFTLEGFLEEALKMQWWLTFSTERDGGTGYTLVFDPTPMGLVKVLPQAINVSLFRPYLWEARKAIVLPSALEALFTLFYTLYVLFKLGLLRTIRYILTEPTVIFCFTFAVIFAFAVGFTSMNFGALARYKIPCLPFYFIGLIILSSKIPPKRTQSSKGVAGIESNEKPSLV